jgi:transposase
MKRSVVNKVVTIESVDVELKQLILEYLDVCDKKRQEKAKKKRAEREREEAMIHQESFL